MTKVTASASAADLISELQTDNGDLIFHLSGGCCDGSAPMCFVKGDFMIGSVDILIDTVCGCEFYISQSTYQYYENSDIELDVTPGCGSSFSIEAPRGVRFMIRSTIHTR